MAAQPCAGGRGRRVIQPATMNAQMTFFGLFSPLFFTANVAVLDYKSTP